MNKKPDSTSHEMDPPKLLRQTAIPHEPKRQRTQPKRLIDEKLEGDVLAMFLAEEDDDDDPDFELDDDIRSDEDDVSDDSAGSLKDFVVDD